MSKRLSNFEILRMLAMFMVLVLHFLDKGKVLTPLTQPFTVTSYVMYFLECLAIVAVNVYVMITGYFMCESTMKLRRLLQILCQVMWYSLLIPVVMALLGLVDVAGFTTYDWLKLIFPVHMKQYWFVTSYVVLMLLVPFLNQAIQHMNKGQLLMGTLLLTVYQVLPKSVLPVAFTDDDAGYGPLWMVCLYLIAAYIRKYGIPFFSSARKSLLCYLAGAVCMWASMIVMRIVYFKLDAFGDKINFALNYNHILCLFTSVALFYTFVHWTPKETGLVRLAVKAAPYTFGVYLIHEHVLLRYRWMTLLPAASADNIWLAVASAIVNCGLMLLVGLILDWGRSLVFQAVGNWRKLWKKEN